MYDSGARVPMMLLDPSDGANSTISGDKTALRTVSEVASTLDVAPTVLDSAHWKVDSHLIYAITGFAKLLTQVPVLLRER